MPFSAIIFHIFRAGLAFLSKVWYTVPIGSPPRHSTERNTPTMKERLYPRATVTPKGEKALRGGHPWTYADEVTSLSATPEDGGLVDVYSNKDKYLGTGFYNSHSKIRIRLLSRNANDTFDKAFWERRLRYAWEYRKTVMGPQDICCCRIIFGEADQFPGLTVEENLFMGKEITKKFGICDKKAMRAKAKEVILHENVSDDGTLAVQNISGIVSLGHTDKAGSTITVNGTDPGILRIFPGNIRNRGCGR